jgi:CHAT domain-containing protein
MEPDHVHMIDLGEAEEIDHWIAAFRESVAVDPDKRPERVAVQRSPGPGTRAEEDPGLSLRRALFDKLVPALGGGKRLFLALDGELTRLPFELLPDASGRLVLDDYRISYLSCGRDVLRFNARSTGQCGPPLVIADPNFDLGAQNGLPSTPPEMTRGRRSRDIRDHLKPLPLLPNTGYEGKWIAKKLGVSPWLGGDALEGRLKERCRSPRILHLATHGFFLKDQPRDLDAGLPLVGGHESKGWRSGQLPENPLLRSGLVLAGYNTWRDRQPVPEEAEDGLLTAEDVSGLDLLATDLVVLSACETGLGEVHVGEGVFGLQRAFMLAGAKTLIMSLWKFLIKRPRRSW